MKPALSLLALLAVLASAGCGDPPVGSLRPEELVTDAGPDAGAFVDDDGGDRDVGGVRPVSFARDIRPLMSRGDVAPFGCKRCHYRGGGDSQGLDLGGLDLTTLGDLRRGGVSSKRGIVSAGNPDGSALVQKLEGTYARGARMPKDRTPWSAAEIGLVRRWIAEGAKGADDE